MKLKNCDNEEIKMLLRDRASVLQSALDEADLDDTQLKLINRYKSLKSYHQDILYLSAIVPITKLTKLYNCSKTSIYNMLKKIKKELYK